MPEILENVKDVGRRGIQIKRFKGLGEMNAKELFETTMNPARRKLLRIDMTDDSTPAKFTLGEAYTYILMPISGS